jgi:hypothetical protein
MPNSTPENRRFIFWLLAVVFLGLLLRLPGMFWGHHFLGGPTKMALHTDEMYGVNIVNQFLKKDLDLKEGYPFAQAFQTAVFAWPLRKFFHAPFISIFYLGRLNSLFFGLATIFLTGLIGRKLSGKKWVGLLAAVFLALSDLHNTYSHVFIPDVAAVFWFYLAMYLAYLFLRSEKAGLLMGAAAAAGASFATKFNNLAATVVLLVLALFSRRKIRNLLLVMAVAALSVYLASGASFTPQKLSGIKNYTSTYTEENGSSLLLLNLAFIPLNILTGAGLPVFILAAWGALFIVWKNMLRSGWVFSPVAATFGLGLLVYFIIIFNFRMLPARFVLSMIPAASILAAVVMDWSPLLHRNRRWLVPLIIFYLALYTIPAQANFVFEPRERAGQWLVKNIPGGEKISVSAQAFVPPQFQTTFKMTEKTAVLAEQGYERYLSKNNLNYKITGQLPRLGEIYNPNLEYGDDPLILQKIITGDSEYRLAARFETITLTPEWAFWKWLGYHPSLLGKVLIYQKGNTRD